MTPDPTPPASGTSSDPPPPDHVPLASAPEPANALPPRPRRLGPIALRLALFTGVVVLLGSALQWVLADLVGPLGMLVLAMTVVPLQIVSLVVSVLAFVLARRPDGRRETRPLLVGLLVFGLSAYVPWTWLDLETRWRLFAGPRAEVVEQVRRGYLATGERRLPALSRLASAGGAVTVGARSGDSLSVMFYTYRGEYGRGSGFLYTTLDTPPTTLGRDSLFQVVPRKPHWYFVAYR